MRKTRIYGLIGKKLSHSFSKSYFTEKFVENKISAIYQNFEIDSIDKMKRIFLTHNLSGLNVTIPYKKSIIPFLDRLDETAKQVGAVNTIQFKNNEIVGYNTDVIGFEQSLFNFYENIEKKALVLGNGGAAEAVKYVLEKNNYDFQVVTRRRLDENLNFLDLEQSHIENYPLIINCTPVGMGELVSQAPLIPYQFINADNYLFDLIYNPEKTKFLALGQKNGASIKNGLEMLIIQAEAAWKIWHS